jgi:Tol biopolymer transport system component
MLGPNWSVDGRLVYDAVYDRPAGVDGGDIVVATKGPSGWSEQVIIGGEPIDWLPRWSNDGTRIVFLRSRLEFSEGDQFVANADGSRLRKISDRVMSTAGACWTPDDAAIAAMTGELDMPINGQVAATYVLFDAETGAVLAEMPTPRGQGLMDCSWQRLSP